MYGDPNPFRFYGEQIAKPKPHPTIMRQYRDLSDPCSTCKLHSSCHAAGYMVCHIRKFK